MKAVGGPLLCIGDLLCDVGEEGGGDSPIPSRSHHRTTKSPELSIADANHLHPAHLTSLFQENYDQLDKALASTDQSWTALTLKLCTALETANKVVQFSNSQAGQLLEKVEQLERIINQRDSAIAAAKTIEVSPSAKLSK